MKILPTNLSQIAFKGYKPIKDNYGRNDYEFSYPFDENHYDCYLELFSVGKDKNGNYYVTDIIKNSDTPDGTLKLHSGANKVNLRTDYFLKNDTPFAYHYKLVKKGTDLPVYRTDAGDVINETYKGAHEVYNYVVPNGSKMSHGGSMKLIIPDNYNVGYSYNPVLFTKNNILETPKNVVKKSFKHFSNKIGGTLAGVEKALDKGEFDGYSNIISLPIFTDDSLSAHGYWNKNCMQMINSLGNINNYAELQRKMFGKGINFVSDGAFVNEGLEGVHFANVLKYGEKSPYFHWFKASGLKNGPFALGVFGKNQDFVSHKVVNSPYSYKQNMDGTIKISKNNNYDHKRPTYVQIFDTRLVTPEQKRDTKNLIKSYTILDTNNPYDINTHDDTVINYSFEIDPLVYNKNVRNLSEYNKHHDNKIRLDSIQGTKFVNKYVNFELEDKIESNFETWDANTDIAKLNYVYSHSDTEDTKNMLPIEKLERNEEYKLGNIQVQDYVINSGKYWTQKTKDILTLHVAQNLTKDNQSYSTIQRKINEGVLPKRLDINPGIVNNIMQGKYVDNYKALDYHKQIKASMMEFPLDSIEFGDNLVGALASPLITKRASNENEIGKPRHQLSSETYFDNIYNQSLNHFTTSVLKHVQRNIPEKLSQDGLTTQYGAHVLPLIVPEIVKFAVIKSVQPDAKVYVNDKNGEIGYHYDALKEVSLQTLGINGVNPEDDAKELVKVIQKGIDSISKKDKELLIDAITKSIKNTNTQSFVLADMIIDRSEAGLDWRIDAAKDIADIDALRDGKNDFAYTWQQVTDFWQKFTSNVLTVNPNAYVAAEVTNEGELFDIGNGSVSRFGRGDITRKLLNETGMTATANYSSFFTDTIMMFGKKFEYDKGSMEYSIDDHFQKRIFEKMIGGEDYLRTSNLNSIKYSYTFIGNHDKPRALHCFALDMDMFFTDLTDIKNFDMRKRAYKVLEDKFFEDIDPKSVNRYNFADVSPKAVAMAETMRTSFIDTLNNLRNEDEYFAKHYDEIFVSVSRAISDLANGRYLGKNFEADAFGVKPFDVTIDAIFKQAQREHGLNISKVTMIKEKMFQTVTEPAYTKLVGAMKYLVALPGKPTLYAGDDLGATGYEEKTKNIYLQNRGYIHNEWKSEKPFIKKYYNELKSVMALRSRPELDALNNGAVFTLPLQNTHNNMNVSAILRQNTEGKMAISLFNTAGINHNQNEKYYPQAVYMDKIVLTDNHEKIGIKGGLKEGIVFYNANNPEDKYYVHKYNDEYCLEHHDRSPIKIDDSTMILYSLGKTDV